MDKIRQSSPALVSMTRHASAKEELERVCSQLQLELLSMLLSNSFLGQCSR